MPLYVMWSAKTPNVDKNFDWLTTKFPLLFLSVLGSCYTILEANIINIRLTLTVDNNTQSSRNQIIIVIQ